MFAGAEPAHGIKLFEAEAERIDDRVAALASLWLRQLRDFFPHGQVRAKIGIFERHRHGGRLE